MNWCWPRTWIGERGGWWRLIVTLGLYTIGVVLGMLLYTQANISGLTRYIGGIWPPTRRSHSLLSPVARPAFALERWRRQSARTSPMM